MPHIHSYVFLIETEVGKEDEALQAAGNRLYEMLKARLVKAIDRGELGETYLVALQAMAECNDDFSDKRQDEFIYNALAECREEMRKQIAARLLMPNAREVQ